VMGGGTVQ